MIRTVQQLFDITGKNALVTDGSSGLGLQIAQALGEAGAKIVLSSSDAEALKRATSHLVASGIDASWIAADCTIENDIQRLVDETLQRVGHIDILVNNASGVWSAPAEDLSIEAWDKVMKMHVSSYFSLSRLIAEKSMIARFRSAQGAGSQYWGHVINVASIVGTGGNPTETTGVAYNTAKGAVLDLTRGLSAEWSKYNITVNAICSDSFPSKMPASMVAAGSGEIAPPKPLRDGEDLKGLCVLYASDAGKYITGQWMAVSNGDSCETAD